MIALWGLIVHLAFGLAIVLAGAMCGRADQVPQGTLIVECDPADVAVYLDAQIVSVSADSLSRGTPLPVGSYELRLSKRGYYDFFDIVNIEADQPTRVRTRLTRVAASADLTVSVFPRQANVAVHAIDSQWFRILKADELYVVPTGEIAVVASATGYESKTMRLVIREDVGHFVSLHLYRRSRGESVLRSAVFPSWGQFYSERKGPGMVVLTSALTAAALFGYAQIQYDTGRGDYEDAVKRYRTPESPAHLRQAIADMDREFDDLQKWHRWRRRGARFLLAVWAYSVLDVLMINPPAAETARFNIVPFGPQAAGAIWRYPF